MKRPRSWWPRLGELVLLGGLLGVVAGCESPLVGGACLEGLRACGGRCVDLDGDPSNCGACGQACFAGEACRAGVCVPSPGDGGWPEGGRDGGGEGGTPDGGGGGGCGLGETACGGSCVRLDRDPAHCGRCGRRCAAGQVCAAGSCADRCEAPLVACGGLCVDLSSDPDHCGRCGQRCASGLCRDGSCVDGRVGHVVVIGHSYARRRAGMNQLLGNAVFLGLRNPVRVLLYEGTAGAASQAGVRAAIDAVAMRRGLSWVEETAQDGAVTDQLADADVFVVLPQQAGTDDELRALGTGWATALSAFLGAGGVVVLLDGGGSHAGTWQVGDAAGIFEASGRVDVTGATLRVETPGDAVALGVPLEYLGERLTVRFEGTTAPIVVAHPDGPVVLHRVVLP